MKTKTDKGDLVTFETSVGVIDHHKDCVSFLSCL